MRMAGPGLTTQTRRGGALKARRVEERPGVADAAGFDVVRRIGKGRLDWTRQTRRGCDREARRGLVWQAVRGRRGRHDGERHGRLGEVRLGTARPGCAWRGMAGGAGMAWRCG